MNSENQNQLYQGVRRNAPCPCGSGKRFKSCHGGLASQQVTTQSNPAPSPANIIPNNKVLGSNDELFCRIEGTFYELADNQKYLFVAKQSNARIQLDQTSCHILHEIDVFATYAEHYAACSKSMHISKEEFQQNMDILYQHGILESAKVAVKKLIEPAQSNPAEIAGICIRTCESPDYLKRILASQISRKNKFGAAEKVYVFDDSSTHQAQRENQQIIEKASSEIDVCYHGLEWQRKFVDALIQTFPADEKEIRWLLLPQDKITFSAGRMTNLALLFFAGKRYLNFDDDFILDKVRIHQQSTEKTIQLGNRVNNVFDGYETTKQVETSGTALDTDPLQAHKQSLGLTLSGYLNNLQNKQFSSKSLRGIRHQELGCFQSESIIITTGNGWFGTPGKRNGRFIYAHTYTGKAAPWKYAESFQALLQGGYCWDSLAQTSVIKKSSSTPAGINNTQFLAPTITICRGEDTLLCAMASAVYPDSVHLGFPWALAHFRQPKYWLDSTLNEPPPLQLPTLIVDITSNLNIPASATNHLRVELISSALLKVAHLSEKQFKEQLQSGWLSYTTSLINQFYQQIDALSEDEVDQKEIIERMIKNDLGHLDKNQLPSIEDAVGDTEEEQIKWAQRELKAYANGLRIWPRLWKHCANSR